MKPILCSALLTLLALTFAACDEVKESERLIYVPPVKVARTVLVEDFTGQRCVNCPAASTELEKLQQRYGDDAVIVVGIHSGPFAEKTPLRTDIGDDYYYHWGVAAQPGAIINRASDIEYDPAQYAGKVSTALEQHTPLTLSVSTALEPGSRQLSVTVEAETSEEVSGKLQVWILEDHVVSPQYFPNNVIEMEFSHNHVFRTSLTSDNYGDALSVLPTQPASRTYTTILPDSWNTANLSAVAFVYNSQGVVQAAKVKVEQFAAVPNL